MSEPTTDDGPRPLVVVGVTVVAVALIAATTLLILAGKSIGDLLAVLAVAGGFVASIFGSRIHSTVQEVKANTNGRISALQDAVIQMAQQATNQASNTTNQIPAVPPIEQPPTHEG